MQNIYVPSLLDLKLQRIITHTALWEVAFKRNIYFKCKQINSFWIASFKLSNVNHNKSHLIAMRHGKWIILCFVYKQFLCSYRFQLIKLINKTPWEKEQKTCPHYELSEGEHKSKNGWREKIFMINLSYFIAILCPSRLTRLLLLVHSKIVGARNA